MKIPTHILQNIFLQNIPRARKKNNHVCYGRCIVCGDSKHNKKKLRLVLLTNKDPSVVYCHNCGLSTTAEIFFKKHFPTVYENLIGTIYENIKREEIFNEEDRKNSQKEIDNAIHSSNEFEELHNFLKEECVSLDNQSFLNKVESKAFDYLEARMISRENIGEMYYCSCPTNKRHMKFKDHIIIPYYNEMNLPYYFQARYFGYNKNRPRYITCDFSCCPNKAVYNERRVDYTNIVYITEGIIDSMNISNAISVTGVGISEDLIQYLSERFEKRVWVNDNDGAGNKLTEYLLKNGQRCFIWPKGITVKDVNEMAVRTKSEFIPKKWIDKNSYSGIEGLGALLNNSK